ncbi:hypothetical protein AKJ09_08168 [Labilithrix luteola]|uniref:Uncharacterized protein n=1 Tax=Labilithrix luteola TaxID=1391654 RepID=A0A0K1Q7W7_9BACT|nr:hypothetical protein [Labilithrix luteola]AKV01505.1 hypothetical protein AKJ09_08168 [Labilithrix luteola]
MSTLRGTIEGLASQFASSVIEALRGASIDELLDVAQGGAAGGGGGARRGRVTREVTTEVAVAAPRVRRGRGGRLGRRSANDIAAMINSIVSLLQQNPGGLRAEQIREALGVEAKELPRPLGEATDQGLISKEGQKRATTYFAGGGAAKRGGAKAAGGRGRKRG